MNADENTLPQQMDALINAVAECAGARQRVTELQEQVTRLDQERAEHLQVLQQHNNQQQQQQISSLQQATQLQKETLQADLTARQESSRHQLAQSLDQRSRELKEEIEGIKEQEKSELWVLLSVLDEDAVDSPTEQLERERETFRQNSTAIEERAAVIEEQITRTQQFLSQCHAATDRENPAPQPWISDDRELTEIIRQTGDEVLTRAANLEARSLPQWTRGSRLWLLSLAAAVVVFVPVLMIKPDTVRGLISPEITQPDWAWLGVAALSGLLAGAFFSVTCLMILQSRLRNGFQAMLQDNSNTHSLTALWKQQMEQRIGKMERAAEKWQRQVARRREQKTAKIHSNFSARRQAVEQQIADAEASFQKKTDTLQEQLMAEQQTEHQRLDRQLRDDQQAITESFQSALREQHAECHRRFDASTGDAVAEVTERIQVWQQAIEQTRYLSRLSIEAAAGMRRWPNVSRGWTAPTGMPASLTPGDFLLTLPQAPETLTSLSAGSVCIEMPAVLGFPQNMSLLVEHDATGREAAFSFLRTQILRLLTTIPPGRIRFTLIDPVGLGQSFSAMMHLADYDELIIQNRIWTDELQIRHQLKTITEHMENVFQTYLRSEFRTIEEYNVSAGEVAEPWHFVVVAGFPQGFSEDAARHLSSILTSGPNCGVHALIAWNPATGYPPGFDATELHQNCTGFRVHDGTVIPSRELPPGVQFEACEEPGPEDYVRLVRAVGEQSKDARRVEVGFRRIAPKPDAIWTQSTADGIDLPIGRAGAARLQFLRLGRGTSQHVLVAGKTGSGKSTFLHIVITNLALHYGPDEIQFYLVDFKKGVEFRTYAANRLPHAKVVAIESDREFGLSVLDRLDILLQQRGELFRTRGVQDIPSFRQQFPDEPMPRLLLLIDEFQEFFVAEDRVASRASLLLDRLIRQGRAFGIHVMLGSQTLGGAYSLARSTMGQVAVRVALQCSESDAHLILSEDNAAARLLTRPGEAIYNDANGLKEGNHPFQIAWLGDEIREEHITALHRRPVATGTDSSMIVFEGNVSPTVEHCAPLRMALQSTADATRRSFDARSIWLGEPVAIAAPTQISLRRAGGQNLLLVGQDEALIDSMLALIVLSVCIECNSEADLTLLLSPRHAEDDARFQSLIKSRAVARCKVQSTEAAESVIQSLSEELKRREELPEHAAAAEKLLVIRDIGQFRNLRRQEDEFSLGTFGEPREETLATRFGELIRRGPLVGIHVIVWADTFSNAMRWLSTSLLREFENRIALRMNQTDSASLVDSPVAAGLGSGRALLYRDETGTVEKFRPFEWPNAEWLKQVASWRSGESDSGLDIESLQIE